MPRNESYYAWTDRFNDPDDTPTKKQSYESIVNGLRMGAGVGTTSTSSFLCVTNVTGNKVSPGDMASYAGSKGGGQTMDVQTTGTSFRT